MQIATWDRLSRMVVVAATVGLLTFSAPGSSHADAPESGVDQREVREAVSRGLGLVRKAAENYPTHRSCFSCHHQTLPMLALVTARAHGTAIDDDMLEAQAEFSRESFQGRLNDLKEGKGIGGSAMTVSYGLWALELAGHEPDDVTEAMVTFLLKTQNPEGHWSTYGRRPPLEESVITCTVLSALGMRTFAAPGQREVVNAAIDKAVEWLEHAPVKSQEDRNFRLWGLHRLGACPEDVRQAREVVLAAQHEDGGWSQRDDMASDAYATGQTLALLAASGFPLSEPSARRGVAFLLKTRRDDGSWKVETRSMPVQTYFDNGDPHGKHQFISTPASCWAVAALAASTGQDRP